MTAPQDSDNGGGSRTEEEGVLANLPRTRPQRETARRTAARARPTRAPGAPAQGAGEAAPSPARPAAKTRPATTGASAPKRPAAKRRTAEEAASVGERAKAASSANGAKARARRTASRPARRTPAPAAQEPVPRQGFESEGERLSGTVQPPGGSEFLAGAFELAGELAKAGISTGERLLKDALGRLPLS